MISVQLKVMPSATRERNYLPPVVTKALPGATRGRVPTSCGV